MAGCSDWRRLAPSSTVLDRAEAGRSHRTPELARPNPVSAPQSSAVVASDPELAQWLNREFERQTRTLSLIASENHCSSAVREACSSYLTDKYAEGYPSRRYYGGCEVADEVENLARDRAKQLFGADHANVQPHSGTTANLAVLTALAGPGGRIVGMALNAGGHLSHGYPASHTGVSFDAKHYGVDADSGRLNYDEVESLVAEHRPAVLIAGASSYPREIDYARMASIAHSADAKLLADIAHPAGLIAAGVLSSPVGHADVITTTTHKTLRGPRGGLILCREGLAKVVDRAVFPGAQGGPLMHQIAGKAMAFGEALGTGFRDYATQVRNNARALATRLEHHGLQVVTGGTDSHMVVIDLRGLEATGADVEKRALEVNLSVNKNMVPGDPRKPMITSGIRVGTAAATTRGLGTGEMETLGDVLRALIAGEDLPAQNSLVADLCERFPLP